MKIRLDLTPRELKAVMQKSTKLVIVESNYSLSNSVISYYSL